MARDVTHRYGDPLDEIWQTSARRIGFRVERTAEAYAVTHGDGAIRVGTPDLLDADDGLAQMILHELCHALVEGEDAWRLPDWGLCNMTARDEPREQACLRLQATLLRPHGLRWVLAPTTDYRSFYDALPDEPLAGDASSVLARIALGRARRAPFAPHLEDALAATAAIGRAAGPFADPQSLWSRAEPPPARHPLGFLAAPQGSCGGCTWCYRSRGALRCRQADGARLDPSWAACERWEPDLDCQSCGACCREAYHSVTVPPRDPVVARHPDLVVRRSGYLEILRDGDRCAALTGTGDRYACRIYEDRPRPCRDFTRQSANCLEARRRVGLSR